MRHPLTLVGRTVAEVVGTRQTRLVNVAPDLLDKTATGHQAADLHLLVGSMATLSQIATTVALLQLITGARSRTDYLLDLLPPTEAWLLTCLRHQDRSSYQRGKGQIQIYLQSLRTRLRLAARKTRRRDVDREIRERNNRLYNSITLIKLIIP